MKITTLILFAALMQVSAAGLAQKLTLQKNKTSLKELFAEIKKQTSYNVVWDSKIIENAKPLTVNYKNTEIETVLDEVLPSRGLEYNISDKTIVIKQKEASLIDRIVARFQAIDVRGLVYNENLEPLSEATVKIKGGKRITFTNERGEFFLKNVEEDEVVEISYIGYKTREFKGIANLGVIKLEPSDSKLDEVQIQAYGKTSRRLSTGGIFTINADQISKQPVDNPLLTLMGRVPNLKITQTSGLPGAPINIQLRGQNSLIYSPGTGTLKPTEPLIVIDGVPYSNNIPGAKYQSGAFNLNALSFINPSDIESINVLADADATSIYGSRGGNGVILITTKHGKNGAAKIEINARAGFSDVSKKLELLSTPKYLELRKEAFINDGLEVPSNAIDAQDKNTNNYDLSFWDQNRYTDWQEVLLGGTGVSYTTTASISGGREDIQYLISGNYYRTGYVFPGTSKWTNGNGHFVVSGSSPNKRFRASVNGSYGVQNSISPFDYTLLAMTIAPNAPSLLNQDGEINWELNPLTGRATWENPLARQFLTTTQKTETFNVSTDLSYQLTTGLKIKTTFGYNNINIGSFSINRSLSSLEPAQRNVLTGITGRNDNDIASWTVDPQITYNTYFLQGKFEGLLGGTYQGNTISSQYLESRGYKNDLLIKNLATATSFSSRNSSSEYRYIGAFARLNYNLEDKYIFNLSGRRDGSSRFGPGRQFGNFWSIGSAWIFTQENYIKEHLKYLSFGKLRVSYGSSGNDGINDYGYLELFGVEPLLNGVEYQGVSSLLSSSGATNYNYGWEDSRKLELAIEFGFLKDRILISSGYWRNRSSNQLGAFPLPATAGSTSIIVNQDAKIQNKGIDFSLSTNNIVGHNFTWVTNLNLGIANNKILTLPSDFALPINPYLNRGDSPIGKSFSGIVGAYEYRGINEETGIYQFSDDQGNIVDQSGAYAYAKVINFNPKYSGGLSNTLTYKGMSLDIFFQFTKQIGRNFIYQSTSGVPGSFSGTSSFGNRLAKYMERWHNNGSPSDVQKVSTALFGDVWEAAFKMGDSDRAWTDASFIRLKNLSFSYTIPESITSKLHLRTLRVTAAGQNLLTFTNFEGNDPETQDMLRLPPLRTLTFGFTTQF